MTAPVPPQPPLDIVAVAIAALSWAIGAEAAAIVGPYSVIILSALGGAAWSASRGEPKGAGRTALQIVLAIGLALIATVPAAELIAHWLDVHERWTLAPAAAIIAARPEWVLRWALRLRQAASTAAPRREDQP